MFEWPLQAGDDTGDVGRPIRQVNRFTQGRTIWKQLIGKTAADDDAWRRHLVVGADGGDFIGAKIAPLDQRYAKGIDRVLVGGKERGQLRARLLVRFELQSRDDIGAISSQRKPLAGKHVTHARYVTHGI